MMSSVTKSFFLLGGVLPLWLYAAPSPHANGQPCPMFEEMEKFFSRPFSASSYMASSMKETDKMYLINIDLPGMDKKDIQIETEGTRLKVSGERKTESDSKESSSKSYSKFQQSFQLPADADMDAINASTTNGVLKITIPKSGKTKSKKIEVK